jgi:serine/threonine protein kinase
MIGNQISNYEIKSLIGEGGMGSVFLAEHTQVNRKVAIKVLFSKYLKNEEIKQRFKNEASTLAHLKHPNIVSLYDYLEDENGMFLILEYVEGKQLDDQISQITGPMPEENAIPLIKKILSAFSYAHEKGIVHRDIKPANIIVTKDNDVKILDFGIARILGDGMQGMTKTGTQMGTVFYMAPEQVKGKKADFRSDIYSLGITFYQMLTGINPYSNFNTEYEVYNSIVNEDLPPANEIYPGITKKMVLILKKALSKNPDERFQTCSEFIHAIDAEVVNESGPPEILSKSPSESPPEIPSESHPDISNKNQNKSSIDPLYSIFFSIIGILSSLAFGLVGLVISIVSRIIYFKSKKIGEGHSYFQKNLKTFSAAKYLSIFALIISIIATILNWYTYLNEKDRVLQYNETIYSTEDSVTEMPAEEPMPAEAAEAPRAEEFTEDEPSEEDLYGQDSTATFEYEDYKH